MNAPDKMRRKRPAADASASSPRTRWNRPPPAIPARRWAWPTSRRRYGAGHLRHNPANPHWLNRDRFVLSNGHASMLLYALLHLTGYDLPMDEIQPFRQLHSKTPGHPGARRHARRRDHHRAAWPGPGQCGRHGAGGKDAGRAVQPRPAST